MYHIRFVTVSCLMCQSALKVRQGQLYKCYIVTGREAYAIPTQEVRILYYARHRRPQRLLH